ncbi:hypothetical protein [Moraxella lacunata]
MVFAMKNEKNRPFFKEKSAVDIEISTRILTMKNKIYPFFMQKLTKQ